MRDPDLQRQVEDRGWVVVDLLTESEVRAMVDGYDRLDHEITVDRSFAAGFHATIIDERHDYRVQCHDLIAAIFGSVADRVFDDMTLAMTNFVHKEPGAAAVPDHVDWTMVDEPTVSSLSVWSPLCDTDVSTGCIGVLDRSHLAVSFLRASVNPSYMETSDFGAGLPGRELLPLKAGQGVVFDHRLVHFSTAHLGAEPRVAFTCEMVPSEVPLVHFERIDTGRFRRHVVEPGFFTLYSAGQDPRSVPGHVSCSEVDAISFDQVWPAPDSADVVAADVGSPDVADHDVVGRVGLDVAEPRTATGPKPRRSIGSIFRRVRR
ncbi:MAG: phytanoyl-CoA dioxygenase family protein [Microthrixaceae bacterium]